MGRVSTILASLMRSGVGGALWPRASGPRLHRPRRGMGVLALAAVLVAPTTVVLSPSVVRAATTVSFSYTGSEQTYVVPSGVSSLHVVAVGAPGGSGYWNAGAGGHGAIVSGDLAVTPGETLYVEVGGPAATAGWATAAAAGTGAVAGATASMSTFPTVVVVVAPTFGHSPGQTPDRSTRGSS